MKNSNTPTKKTTKKIWLSIVFIFCLFSFSGFAQGELKIKATSVYQAFGAPSTGVTITIYDEAGTTLLHTYPIGSINRVIVPADWGGTNADTYQIWYSNNITSFATSSNIAVARRLLSVESWGTATLTSLNLYQAEFLELNATDAPTFAVGASLFRAFRRCLRMTDPGNNLGTWDTSNVTNMQEAFFNAQNFNANNLGNWDVGNVTNFSSMFLSAVIFNDASINNWNIGLNTGTALINMSNMFNNADGFNQHLNGWERVASGPDLGSTMAFVNNMDSMFEGAAVFNGSVGTWNVGRVTNFVQMFYAANNPALTVFNNGLASGIGDITTNPDAVSMADWNIGENVPAGTAINMTQMFRQNDDFNQNIGNWDVSKVSSFNEMFYLASRFNNGDAAGVVGTGMQNWNIGANLAPGTTINMNRMFRDALQFNQDLSNWDVTKVTNFTEMFFQASVYQGVGVSNWKISGTNTDAVNMTWMFGRTPQFNEPLASWETDSGSTMAYVTSLSNTFDGATTFNQPLGDWNVARVTNFTATFANMNAFADPAPSINTWNIGDETGMTAITMASMFNNSNAFNTDLASWQTNADSSLEHVSTMNSMFMNADVFNQNLAAWDVSRVRDFAQMFYRSAGVTAFNNGDAAGVVGTNMQNWNIGANLSGAETINMFRMFRQSQSFNQDLSNWDVRRVTNFQETFWTTTVYQGVGLRNWQISGDNTFPINMRNMFGNATAFVEPLATWETPTSSTMGYVTNMFQMLSNADAFNHPIGNWDVGRVTDFGYMFSENDGFSDLEPSINNWNISENNQPVGVNMAGVFRAATAFNNPLEGWETNANSTMAYVTTLRDMFRNGALFNNAVNTWDVGRVGDFHAMFFNNPNFNQPVNNWNIGANRGTGINMSFTFGGATAFNQPVSNWDVSKVSTVLNMFDRASTFDQSLANWTPVTSTDFRDMLNNSGLSVANYDATLISWAQQDLIDNRVLGAVGLEFCAAEPFRASLVSDQGWTVSGDALGCAPGNVSGAGKLLYWVSAGSHLGADGDSVDEWRDISGDGRIFTQTTPANQPTFLNNTTDMVNFNPIMKFDGADDFVEGYDFNQLDPSFPTEPRIDLPITGRSASSELTTGVIPNEVTFGAASSVIGNTFNGANTPGSWRSENLPAENANTTEYLELDLGEIVPLSTIRTRGERANAQPANWVETYTVEISTDGVAFTQLDGVFTGNTNRTEVVRNEFSANTPARYVRIYPQTWSGYPAICVGVGTNGYAQASTFILALEDVRQNNVTQSLYNIDSNNRADISVADGSGNTTVNNSFAGDNSITLSSAAPALNSNPFLINYSVNGAGEAKLYRNGVEVGTDTTPAKYSLMGTTYLGGLPTSDYFNGKIAEANLFADVLTQDERERINTYFAIKYNIPITHNFTYEDEVSNTIETVWDITANAAYNNDVFGVAKDDNQGLNQRVSSSRDTDNVLTVATAGNFTALNSDPSRGALSGVSSFVIMGNDDGAETFSLNGAPNRFKILDRKWYAQVTGTNQDLFFEFNVANTTFDIADPEQTADYYLIKDDNNNNDLSDDVPVLLTNTSGDLWSTPTAVTIANEQLFTLGIAFTSYPGGVATNLALWLKADQGISDTDGTDITTWLDQSINMGNFTGAGNAPNFVKTTANVNFNPYVDFDRTAADRLNGPNYGLSGANAPDYQIYFVYNQTDVGTGTFPDLWDWDGTNGQERIEAFGGNFQNSSIAVSAPLGTWNIGVSGTTADQQSGRVNALNAGSTVGYGNLPFDGNGNVAIGTNGELNANIAEVIYYTSEDTAIDRQKIESYLAIKYGVTLNASAGDYVNTSGTSVYNLATYNNDVFGIAHDAPEALIQDISKSVNSGAILTVSTDADFTMNSGLHTPLDDGQYLIIGNDGGSGNPANAVSTDLETTSYFQRSAREWKASNTAMIGEVNLQFDGYDNSWVLLTRSIDGDFSATSGTTETQLSALGAVAITLPTTTYFTLAQKPVAIEFDLATASDVEATGGNLPKLLIEGVLSTDATIDLVVNAAGTATAGTDYAFRTATGDGAVTIATTIPAGTYAASTPVDLNTLFNDTALDVSYATLVNPPGNHEQETFVPTLTGDYTLTYSSETVNSGTAWVNVGTTLVSNTGSNDILDGLNGDRIDAATPLRTYTISLTAGTTYHLTAGAGGGGNHENVTILITRDDGLSITDEDIVENDETISLSLSNPKNGLELSNVAGTALVDTHVYTITNDDTATITIAADTDATETTASRAFTLTMSEVAGIPIAVSYTLTGTAVAADYADSTTVAGTVTIPAGSTTATIDLTVVDDKLAELDETVIATLTAATNTTAVTATTTPSTLNILGDDLSALRISIGSPVDGTEGTSDVTYTVSLDDDFINATGTPITGTVALTGTATNGTDYTDLTTFSIADGESSATITVAITDDDEVEINETVIATISAPSVGAVNATSDNASADIIDDDEIIVTVVADADMDESVTTRNFTVNLDAIATIDVVIDYVLSGTSTLIDDYTDTTGGSLTIFAGMTSGSISIAIEDDLLVENNETILVTLSSPLSAVTIGTASATMNILDNDVCTAPIDFEVSEIRISTVDLSWSMPTGVVVQGYEWAIFESGADPLTASPVIFDFTLDNETTVDDAGVLEKDTNYDFYVRAICSADVNSSFAGPVSFTTLPDNDDDGIPDGEDDDDDNDGIPDTEEDANGDCDNDGIQDSFDPDPCGEVGSISTVKAAEGFTPNGDGINDTWVIRGIENFPNSVVNVYNRWGHEVFGAIGYQNNWDAIYRKNSEKLPPGSYYYVINLGDNSAPIDGWIFLNY